VSCTGYARAEVADSLNERAVIWCGNKANDHNQLIFFQTDNSSQKFPLLNFSEDELFILSNRLSDVFRYLHAWNIKLVRSTQRASV